MSKKLENAKNLYMHGIRDGHVRDAVTKFTGDRYTQHSTGVEDGVEGFVAFFEPFVKRCPSREMRIIRAIEDGRYVFLHVYQNINHGEAQWVTTDMFDTDENEKIVEHWDVIAAYKPADSTASGNDMILGDFQLRDTDKTEENKALVRSFLTEVFQNKKHNQLDKYVSKNKYIQHNPNVPNGYNAVAQFLATQDFQYNYVFNVIGQGDHVVSYSKGTYNGQELAIFDIFRIENGKIVEHWDNMEPIPPRSEWANTGKF